MSRRSLTFIALGFFVASIPWIAMAQTVIQGKVSGGTKKGPYTVTSTGEMPVDITSATITGEIPVDLDEVAGTTTNVNGGNRDAGTQTVTLADDDPAVTDLAAIEVLNTAIKTAIEIIDDWDESDRAKVNIIAGQAGIAAGAGAVAATVPRVTLASDDPAVTDLAALEVNSNKAVLFNAKIDDDTITNCDDLDTSSEQYTLPTAGDVYEIRVTGNCASILCGTNPTATTAKGGHFIKLCDGHQPLIGPLTGAKCAHIAPSAEGEICYIHKNSAL